MKAILISVALALVSSGMLAGCVNYQARENLRDGLLVLNLSQSDFLEVWDAPNHTSAVSGDEIIKSGIAGWGGFFFKGREMYEMWSYEQRQTKLVFYDRKLVAWKTQQTVQSLAAPPGDDTDGFRALTRVPPITPDQRD